ncbi:MAG: hypothetical protein IPK92_03840 [Nitrospira sp.]|jgi:putative transposase|nr:hypothetical protein [Nitrospira sp.]MBL8053872.1 hypothetical protein [Nitrospira sp.]
MDGGERFFRRRAHALPVVRQCQLLGLARSTAYYQPTPVSDLVRVLMRRMGITAIYCTLRTSRRHPGHRIYLFRSLHIVRSHYVWAADLAYIPMQSGFVYLCAILD